MADKTLSRRDFLRGAAAAGLMATGSLLGIPKAAADELPAVFTPGTYTASAPGMGGDVVVTITVDETSILEAAIDAAGETEGIGKPAAELLAKQIVERQSWEVDSVSGASVTSRAVRQALESCFAQAKGIDVALLQSAAAPAADEAPADWLGEAPVIDESAVTETVDTEVLVIGAGTSGLFAACAAVEEGAKTLLIEKMDEEFGGSGIRDTLAAIGSREQLEDGDNPDKFDVITELYRQSNGYGDQRLYKLWADNSGEAIDWYTDRVTEGGLRFRHEVDSHDIPVRYPVYDVGHSL